MAIVDTHGNHIVAVIWQEGTEEEMHIGEPAIVLKQYFNNSGMVEIKQGHNEVLVNASTLRALARQLNALARRAEQEARNA